MRSLRKLTALALTGVFLATSAPAIAAGSDHVVSAADIQRALQQRTRADAQRDTILGLLQRSDVQDLAARSGLDLRGAEKAVRTLDGEELQGLAQQAAALERELAGGAQTITISIVTLLLIIIIIILLVK